MTSVSITHKRSNCVTLIDVDNKRLLRVISYSLSQDARMAHPVVEVVQHDEFGEEITRTFVPTVFVLRTIP